MASPDSPAVTGKCVAGALYSYCPREKILISTAPPLLCKHGEPFCKVGTEISAVFQADTETDHGLAGISRRRGPHGLGGGDKTLITAPAVAQPKQGQGVDEGGKFGLGIVLFEGETKEAGRAPEIPLPEMMFGMAGQGGMENLVNQWHGLQPFGHRQRRLFVLPQPGGQRMKAAQACLIPDV